MASRSVAVQFVPDEFCERPFAARRIYGAEFTRRELRVVRDAIAEASGLTGPMDMFCITMQVHDDLREKHRMVATYIDDVYVHICMDLGINWKKFPHNTPKLDCDDFHALATRQLGNLALPSSEIQWAAQRKKWTDLWFDWVASQCKARGCEHDEHGACEDLYGRPNFWEIALEHARDERSRMLKSIDAKPRGKAVKAANDAMARIMAIAHAGHANDLPRD